MADRLLHYQKMSHRLHSRSNIMLVQGGHGPSFDFLFKAALIRKDTDGNETVGFRSLDELGGQQVTAEEFDLQIGTDEGGADKEIEVSFRNPHRPQEKMRLKREALNELAEYYTQLHKED